MLPLFYYRFFYFFSTAFEPQDRLFLRTVQDVKANIDQLYHQERRRYKDASYGSFEKSRRFAMLSGLTRVTDQMEKMIIEQHRMLRYYIEIIPLWCNIIKRFFFAF